MIRAFQLAITLLALNFLAANSSNVLANDDSSLKSNKATIEEPNSKLVGNQMGKNAGETIIEKCLAPL